MCTLYDIEVRRQCHAPGSTLQDAHATRDAIDDVECSEHVHHEPASAQGRAVHEMIVHGYRARRHEQARPWRKVGGTSHQEHVRGETRL
jgi:hypothetical protein